MAELTRKLPRKCCHQTEGQTTQVTAGQNKQWIRRHDAVAPDEGVLSARWPYVTNSAAAAAAAAELIMAC